MRLNRDQILIKNFTINFRYGQYLVSILKVSVKYDNDNLNVRFSVYQFIPWHRKYKQTNINSFRLLWRPKNLSCQYFYQIQYIELYPLFFSNLHKASPCIVCKEEIVNLLALFPCRHAFHIRCCRGATFRTEWCPECRDYYIN